VTIEHGHANHLADDWASTAYWYQLLPSPTLSILPVEQRLPFRATGSPAPAPAAVPEAMREEVDAARAAAYARQEDYLTRMGRRTGERIERSLREQEANRDAARLLRERFLGLRS
jgi:hypothetical protein